MEELVDNVMKDIPLYTNSVVLMHDAGNKTSTVEALPIIISQLQEQGVTLKDLDENTEHIQHVKMESAEE